MDRDQLARLIDGHAAALELYARQWCDDPIDVVQSAFVKLIEQSPMPDRPVCWLYRVVRNGAIDWQRRVRRRRDRESFVSRSHPGWFENEPADELDSQTATDALAELPGEQREAVVAHLWGGLTFDEIGELTETSSSTAHRRYAEGIDQLRKRLGIACPNHD